MAREIERLAAISVNRLGPGLHPDGGGLYLYVTGRPARRSWIFRFMLAGRAREMGLGPAHTVGLAEARARARRARLLLLDGQDPIAARQAERQRAQLEVARTITFQTAARQFIAAHRADWRNAKHALQWEATLQRYAYPVFGELAIAAVDTGLVLRALEGIWSAKPETASRVRGRIEAVLDWGRVRGYRDGENPARWKGHLDHLLARPENAKRAARAQNGRGEHHAALPYGEIAGFVAELREQAGMAARALEFAILTAARTGEVLGARWGEISLAERTWAIPAERMKSGREHRVPLSDAAIAALRICANPQTEPECLLFPGAAAGRPLSNMALLMLLRRMGRTDLTAHGFRSTFRDWVGDRTNFQPELAELALAHAVGDKVEQAYRRGDGFQKRRRLMDAWAAFCSAPPAGEVVSLRA